MDCMGLCRMITPFWNFHASFSLWVRLDELDDMREVKLREGEDSLLFDDCRLTDMEVDPLQVLRDVDALLTSTGFDLSGFDLSSGPPAGVAARREASCTTKHSAPEQQASARLRKLRPRGWV